MQLSQSVVALPCVLLAVVAALVTEDMNIEARALIVGVACGVAAGILTSMLLMVLARREQRESPTLDFARMEGMEYLDFARMEGMEYQGEIVVDVVEGVVCIEVPGDSLPSITNWSDFEALTVELIEEGKYVLPS